jgi:hypothetical protein
LKPSILVGVVIAVLVLAAGLLAPQFRSSSSKAAEQARQQAALAERLLHAYDVHLPELERLARPAALKDADFEGVAKALREDLSQLNQEYARLLGQMQNAARAAGLPPPSIPLVSADASGLKRALEQYQRVLKENADRLAQAVKTARDARSGVGDSVLGVPQVAGMAEYARAAGLFTEAQVYRQEQQALQARLLRLGGQWKDYRAYQDYLVGLDVRDILSTLRTDLEKVRQDAATGKTQAEAAAAEVAKREAELTRVQHDLKAARDEILALEKQGFTAGQDDSFNAYREKYAAISKRLQTLQEEEQLLSQGGLRGAKITGDDLETAKLEGGEAVVGLEQMKRELAIAQEKAKRLADAVESLQKHLGFVEEAGKAAKQGEGEYARLLEKLDAQQKAIVPQILTLAKTASDKETEALAAAREAVRAFEASQQAADKWVSAAGQAQSTSDPDRRNPRLSRMVGDATLPQVGVSAQAEALMLTARIHAQRLDGNQSLLNDMNRFVELRPGTSFTEAGKCEDDIRIARDNAVDAAKKAAEIYKKLVNRAAANTKWVPQAALASVYHLLAQVSATDSATLLATALQAAEDAVKDRENSPYLTRHVQFRDYLLARTGGGKKEPGTEEPTPEKSDQPAEGGNK